MRRGTVGWAIVRRLCTPALLTFALAALALLARSGATVSLDAAAAEPIRGLARTPLGALFALLDHLAGFPAWTVLVALAAILSWRLRPRGAALLLLGDLSAELATAVLKAVVDRPRPPSVALADLVPTASFPSGHVVRTLVALGVAAALVLPSRLRRWVVGAAALFVLVLGFARAASGEHWPSDVIGGYLLGGLWLSILLAIHDDPRWQPERWVRARHRSFKRRSARRWCATNDDDRESVAQRGMPSLLAGSVANAARSAPLSSRCESLGPILGSSRRRRSNRPE